MRPRKMRMTTAISDPDLLPLESTTHYRGIEALPEPDDKKERFVRDRVCRSTMRRCSSRKGDCRLFRGVAAGRRRSPPTGSSMTCSVPEQNRQSIGDRPLPSSAASSITGAKPSRADRRDLFEIVLVEGRPGRIRCRDEAGDDTGAIEKAVDETGRKPDQVAKVLASRFVAGWFVGQVMKSTAAPTPAVQALAKPSRHRGIADVFRPHRR